MATTFVSYTASGTDYDVTFPFIRKSDVAVTVNGDEATFEWLSDTRISITSSVAGGDDILIYRSTDLDEPAVDFVDDASLLAENLNMGLGQVLYGLQEFDQRLVDVSLISGNLPSVSAANRFLISESNGVGGFQWSIKTSAQAATILGAGQTVPAPVSGNQFLITNASTDTYELATLAAAKAVLGITYTLPDVTVPQANYFAKVNSAGTAYEIVAPAAARSALGLGTAAQKDTGTAVGNVPELVSNGGAPALPAVSGANLTGVQKELFASVWTGTGTPTSASSYTSLTASLTQDASSSYGSADGFGFVLPSTGKYLLAMQTKGGGSHYIKWDLLSTGGSPTVSSTKDAWTTKSDWWYISGSAGQRIRISGKKADAGDSNVAVDVQLTVIRLKD